MAVLGVFVVTLLVYRYYVYGTGNDPEEIDLLNSVHKESAITSAVSFKNLASGPVALAVSRDFNMWDTSTSLIVKSVRIGSSAPLVASSLDSSLEYTDAKY